MGDNIVAKRKGGQSRSAFVREQLESDINKSPKDVIEAWKAVGGVGEIKPNLVYLVKSKMKAGNAGTGRRGRPPASASSVASPKPAVVSEGSASYEHIEAGLDDLIFRAIELRDNGLVTELRKARRHVSSQLVG